MSGNGKPIPFKPALAQAVPIVGQPFVIEAAAVPVTIVLRCNCGGADPMVRIHQSASAACPSCRRVYHAALNPLVQPMRLEIGMSVPEAPPQGGAS